MQSNGQHIAGYATFAGDVFCVECVADMVRGGEWGEDTEYDAREGVAVIRDAHGFAPLLDAEGEYVRPVLSHRPEDMGGALRVCECCGVALPMTPYGGYVTPR